MVGRVNTGVYYVLSFSGVRINTLKLKDVGDLSIHYLGPRYRGNILGLCVCNLSSGIFSMI